MLAPLLKNFLQRIKKSVLFILLFFIPGCDSPSLDSLPFKLNREDYKDLECFFNLLFFEEGGAFVTLGSKPMCSASIIDIDTFRFLQKEQWESMNEEERIEFQKTSKKLSTSGILPKIRLSRNPYKGYLIWEKFSSKLDRRKFLMILQAQGESFFYPIETSPQEEKICGYDLIFASIPKTVAILAEHYDVFRQIAGMDFDPFSIVYELENPSSIFWRRIFQRKEHIAKGLLFGYGEKNAALFDAQARHFDKEDPFSQEISNLDFPRSTTNFKKIMGIRNHKNFSIPFFLSIDPTVVNRYKEEKRDIEDYYKRKEIVYSSLELLIKKRFLTI